MKVPKKNLMWWGGGIVFMIALLAFFIIGCQGAVGPTGETGPAGSAGIQGPAGPPGVITGTISGVVLDDSGTPIEKATVATEPANPAATTDADGKFSLKDVAAGQYVVIASAAGKNASASKVSVLAGKDASVKLTLGPADPFSLGLVRAVSFRTGDLDVLPDNKVAITLSAGYGKSNNNNIITSGLNNVPVGTYVYLQGKETDDHDAEITGWSWSVIGPREKNITVENAKTSQPRFMADAEGKYEVTGTATTEEGKFSYTIEVFASRYVGVQNCATCHSGSVKPDIVSEWKETGHATKFEDTYASYAPARDYCIRCHTVGYDETSKAGGFADAARQAGWSPDKGSVIAWLKNNNWTIDRVMKSPMGQFANVQCESCHGPGSVHEGIVESKEYGSLMQPGVCSQCHPQEQQWRNSGHSLTGSKNLHTAEGASCIECHTGQGFVTVKIRGQQPVFPNLATAGKPANVPDAGNMAPVACATCHDPHGFPEPFNKGTAEAPNMASLQLRLEGNVTMPNGVTVDAKESAVCVSCHANKRDQVYKSDYLAGKKTRGAHDNTQADVFYGVTSAVFDFDKGDYASSPHKFVVEEACIQCHMAANPKAPAGAEADGKQVVLDHGNLVLITAGGHTWSMEGDYKDTTVENTTPCAASGCHVGPIKFNRPAFDDYDGDGLKEGIQDEVQGLLALVAAELPKDDKGAILSSTIKPDNTTELQRQALWNYWTIANDGSNGVHNAGFSVQVLQRTYKMLTGKDVPGAALR
ncbi:MAG: carboxypeptidase regulatory-like domain-containing protein [Chloroflexi bacterium]|nr:carboxypeptidase regulatory-like domain-containing protein [Chloroflexota bacterium]